MMKKIKTVKVGDAIAFNTLDDAAWYEVLELDGVLIICREIDTEVKYAPITIDRCYVVQVKEKR